MDFASLLQTTFSYYTKLFKQAVIIALIPSFLQIIISIISSMSQFMISSVRGAGTSILFKISILSAFAVFILIVAAASIVLFLWAGAAITILTDEYRKKRKISANEALNRSKAYILNIIVGKIVVFFRVVIGLLLLIVPGILAILNNSIYQQAIVLENRAGSQGAARSRELIKRNYKGFAHPRWYVLAMIIIVSGIKFGISAMIGLPLMITGMVWTTAINLKMLTMGGLSQGSFVTFGILNGISNAAAAALIFPLFIIFATLFFHDLKEKSAGQNEESVTPVRTDPFLPRKEGM